MVVILVAWAIVSLLKPASLNISPTNISLDSGIAVTGDKILTYNGSSFIEISPGDDTTKVVYTPKTRFPSVRDMVYAPGEGVLLTFSGSTISTPVFDYKLKHNQNLASDNNYTWYLDFKTDKLTQVFDFEVPADLMYYNSSDNKFYLINGNSYEGYNDFLSFDFASKKLSMITNDLDFSDITNMHQCGDSTCLIGSLNATKDKSTIAQLSASGKMTKVKDVDGKILPTPNNTTFALLTDPDNSIPEDEYVAEENEDDPDKDEYSAGIVSYRNLTMLDISTDESRDYEGIYNVNGSIGSYDDNFYYMNGTDGTYQYFKRSAKDLEFKYDTDEYDFDYGFINIAKIGQSFALIADTDREVYIVSTTADFNTFNIPEPEQVSKNIDTCVDQVNSNITVQGEDDITADFDIDFEILVPDDTDFNSTIYKMNQCLGADTSNLIGYSYRYTGVSPINGKITTE